MVRTCDGSILMFTSEWAPAIWVLKCVCNKMLKLWCPICQWKVVEGNPVLMKYCHSEINTKEGLCVMHFWVAAASDLFGQGRFLFLSLVHFGTWVKHQWDYPVRLLLSSNISILLSLTISVANRVANLAYSLKTMA